MRPITIFHRCLDIYSALHFSRALFYFFTNSFRWACMSLVTQDCLDQSNITCRIQAVWLTSLDHHHFAACYRWTSDSAVTSLFPLDQVKGFKQDGERCLMSGVVFVDSAPIPIHYKTFYSIRKPGLKKNIIVCPTGLVLAGNVQHGAIMHSSDCLSGRTLFLQRTIRDLSLKRIFQFDENR